MIVIILYLAVLALLLVSYWKIYEKAGRQGWEGIIPIYNLYVLTIIIKKEWYWMLLILVPIVGPIILMIELAKAFGQSTVFGVLMAFFGIILIPVLAFGDYKYVYDPQKQGISDVLDSDV